MKTETEIKNEYQRILSVLAGWPNTQVDAVPEPERTIRLEQARMIFKWVLEENDG